MAVVSEEVIELLSQNLDVEDESGQTVQDPTTEEGER